MLQLINPDRYGEFIDDLAEMHRLRYRIFKERLGWDVQVSGDMEVDEFDACRPVYLLQRNDGRSCSGLRAALADDRPHHASRHVPGALGRTGRAGIRRHLGKQPLRRRSLHQRGEDGRQHRASDLRTLRRHDRVRLDAAAHRYRHRDGRPDGADSLPRALASETSRLRRGRSEKRSRSPATSKSLASGFSASGKPEVSTAPRSATSGGRPGRFITIEAMERAVA